MPWIELPLITIGNWIILGVAWIVFSKIHDPWPVTRRVLILSTSLTLLATFLNLTSPRPAAAYQEPELPIEHPEACFVVDLDAPCVPMPLAMARDINPPALARDDRDVHAVGKLGELGWLQLHPVHAAAMRAAGLNHSRERDRIAYAVLLWERTGSWREWSCKP